MHYVIINVGIAPYATLSYATPHHHQNTLVFQYRLSSNSAPTKRRDHMSSELRQQNVNQNTAVRESDPLNMVDYDEALLSAHALLAAPPTHSGAAMKMHIPVLYTFLPATIQWFLSRCCPRGWSPQWKRRHLVALGEYLYRFKDENGSTPKGSPIPMANTEARLINNDDEFSIVFDHLPEGCDAVFEISSIGKTQYFAVESREEAMIWVNSLRQMRQDTITRKMGHSAAPYPKEWTSFDASAKRLKDKKTRIKSKLEVMNKKEQEMTTLGGGPPSGMGYFG